MPHVIHYLDDLFLIDGLARFVLDLSRLEPDADVVGDSALALVRSADRSFCRVRDLVGANGHLVERAEYLRLLARAAATFAEALDNLQRPESPLAPAFREVPDELERLARAYRAAAGELRDQLHAALDDGSSAEELVSGDELSELLRGGDSV